MSPKVFNYVFAMFAIRGSLSFTNISFKIVIQDVVGTYLSFFLIRVEAVFICSMLRGVTVWLSPLYPNGLYHLVQIFVAGHCCLVPPPETIT